MEEKNLVKICTMLKDIVLKPIVFGDIRLELLEVLRSRHAPGTYYAAHCHPWFEFNYFSDGRFTTLTPKGRVESKAGKVLLIPPGVQHEQKSGPSGDDGICLRWQLTSEDSGFMKRISSMRMECFEANMGILLRSGASERQKSAALLDFVLSVCDNSGSAEQENEDKRMVSHQAILYMEEYLKEQITAEDVAGALNMSYRNLARVFRRETGAGLTEKLGVLRAERAMKLLTETDLPITDIAGETGFANVHYFSNSFKKHTGMSPKEYRRENSTAAQENTGAD